MVKLNVWLTSRIMISDSNRVNPSLLLFHDLATTEVKEKDPPLSEPYSILIQINLF